MPKRPALTALLLSLSLPLCAFDPHPIEAELSRCMESAEGMSTVGMKRCLATATEAWDGELNKVYRELMAAIDAEGKKRLRAAQRSWIAFRDAELDALVAIYGAMGGTMFQVMHADAVSALTRDRVRQLEATLEAQRVSEQ